MEKKALLIHNGLYCTVHKTPIVSAKYSNEAVKTSLVGSKPQACENFQKMLQSLKGRKKIAHKNIHWFFVQENVVKGPTGISQPVLTLNREWYDLDILQYVQRLTSMGDKLKLLLPLAEAIKSLHDNDIVHGHICPANIFVVAEEEGSHNEFKAVLTDVGVHAEARQFLLRPEILPPNRKKPGDTSPIYQAPEWQTNTFTPPGKPSDVYALAGVVFTVVTGNLPFYAKDLHNFTASSHLDMINPGIGDNLWAILQECWRVNPNERPDMWDVSSKLDYIWMYRLEEPTTID